MPNTTANEQHDKSKDKGQGLGFMLCCCAPKVDERDHTADR